MLSRRQVQTQRLHHIAFRVVKLTLHPFRRLHLGGLQVISLIVRGPFADRIGPYPGKLDFRQLLVRKLSVQEKRPLNGGTVSFYRIVGQRQLIHPLGADVHLILHHPRVMGQNRCTRPAFVIRQDFRFFPALEPHKVAALQDIHILRVDASLMLLLIFPEILVLGRIVQHVLIPLQRLLRPGLRLQGSIASRADNGQSHADSKKTGQALFPPFLHPSLLLLLTLII